MNTYTATLEGERQRLSVLLLGPLRVVSEEGEEVPVPGPKAPSALALIALAHPQPVAKQQLHEVLWEGQGEINVVERQIGSLRKKFGLEDAFLVTTPGGYRLRKPTDLTLARRELQAAVHEMRSGAEESLRLAERALARWRAQPLADLAHGRDWLDTYLIEVEKTKIGLYQTQVEALRKLGRNQNAFEVLDSAESEFPKSIALVRLKVDLLDETTRSKIAGDDYLEHVEQSYVADGVEPPSDLRRLVTRDGPRVPSRPLRGRVQNARGPVLPAIDASAEDVVAHNVPGAAYTKLIGREMTVERVKEALAGRRPVVALSGLNGHGKTTVAHHVAIELSEGDLFRQIVWCSDRERPGTLTLNTIFDTFAVTTNNSSVSRLEQAQKARAVRDLTRNTATLFVIDNYESLGQLDQDEIGAWIGGLTGGTKAMITTSRNLGKLASQTTEIQITPPPKEQASDFIQQALDRPRMPELQANSPKLMQLWDDLGGNPRLVELALGQASRRGLDEVLRDMRTHTSRMSADLLAKLFAHTWATIGSDELRMLLVADRFVSGISFAEFQALAVLDEADAEAVMDALLDQFFLIRVNDADGFERFKVEPLVARHLANIADLDNIEFASSRERWIDHFQTIAESIGFCPHDVNRLAILDDRPQRLNLLACLEWCAERPQYAARAITIARETRYYWYVRGLWSMTRDPHLLRANCARALGAVEEEVEALVYLLNIKSKQQNIEATEAILERVEELVARRSEALSGATLSRYRHAKALFLFKVAGDHDGAIALWSQNLDPSAEIDAADLSASARWYAECLIRSGADNHATRTLLHKSLDEAQAGQYSRAIVAVQLQLADLEITDGTTPAADIRARLLDMEESVKALKDPKYLADLWYALSRVAADSTERGTYEQSAVKNYKQIGLEGAV